MAMAHQAAISKNHAGIFFNMGKNRFRKRWMEDDSNANMHYAISRYPQRNRALLWHGFHGNMGMIVDGLEATPCRKGHIERLSCHRRRHSMPGFVASALH